MAGQGDVANVAAGVARGARVRITLESGLVVEGVVERGAWDEEDGWRVDGEKAANAGYFYWVERAEPGTLEVVGG